MAVFPTRALEIEFDAGVWTDITAYVSAISSRRGRNRESGAFETGRLIVTVQNSDRRFDPDHATGPYYGKLRPNRRIRWRETYSAVTYPIFVGYIDRIAQVPGGPNDATAIIEASDFFKILNRVELPRSVYYAEVATSAPNYWWPMDEPAEATRAVDIVAGLTADRIGTATFGAPSLPVHDSGGGYNGDGLWPGGLQLTTGQAVPISGSNGFTLEFLYKGTGGNYVYRQLVGSQVFNIYINNGTGKFTVEFIDGATLKLAVVSSVNINDGATHHVAAVYNNTDLRFYIDGVYDSGASVIANTASLTFTAGIGTVHIFTGGFSTSLSLAGIGDEFAIYLRALTSTEVATHNTAARTPWNGDTPGQRLDRIFGLADVPAGDLNIGGGDTTLQSTDLGGTALAYAQKVEETDLGWLFVARDGKVTYIGRRAGQTGGYLTSKGTLVDADSGAGLPYRATDATVDEAFIVTRSTASREGSVAVTVYDAAAQAEFGWIDENHDGLLHDSDAYSLSYARWVLNTHRTPQTRIGQVDVELTGDPANLYPFALGLELADRVTYKRKPQNTGAVTTLDMRVEAVSHETAGGYWRTRLQLSPFNLGEGGYPVWVWGTTKWGQHVWGI